MMMIEMVESYLMENQEMPCDNKVRLFLSLSMASLFSPENLNVIIVPIVLSVIEKICVYFLFV